jgi:hypothetical protein
MFWWIVGGIAVFSILYPVWLKEIKPALRQKEADRQWEARRGERELEKQKEEEKLKSLYDTYRDALNGTDRLAAIEAGREYYSYKRFQDGEMQAIGGATFETMDYRLDEVSRDAELRDETKIQSEVSTMNK